MATGFAFTQTSEEVLQAPQPRTGSFDNLHAFPQSPKKSAELTLLDVVIGEAKGALITALMNMEDRVGFDASGAHPIRFSEAYSAGPVEHPMDARSFGNASNPLTNAPPSSLGLPPLRLLPQDEIFMRVGEGNTRTSRSAMLNQPVGDLADGKSVSHPVPEEFPAAPELTVRLLPREEAFIRSRDQSLSAMAPLDPEDRYKSALSTPFPPARLGLIRVETTADDGSVVRGGMLLVRREENREPRFEWVGEGRDQPAEARMPFLHPEMIKGDLVQALIEMEKHLIISAPAPVAARKAPVIPLRAEAS